MLQLFARAVGVSEPRVLDAHVADLGGRRLEIAAEPTGQTLECRKATLDVLETFCGTLERREGALQLVADVAQGRLDRRTKSGGLFEGRIKARQFLKTLPHHGELAERRLVVLIEAAVRLDEEPLDAIGVGKALPVDAEFVEFTGRRRDLVVLGELEREPLDTGGALSFVHRHRVDRRARLDPGSMATPDICAGL